MKVLLYRFHLGSGAFNMLTVEGSSKTGLLRRLSNPVFRSLWFQKYISYETHLFFSNSFKFDVYFRKKTKNYGESFNFLDNLASVGCGKFSLLPR